jgi:hypothetical protein
MKKILLSFIILFFSGCTQNRNEPSDEYVLIEFAAKLEQDSSKISPQKDGAPLTQKER